MLAPSYTAAALTGEMVWTVPTLAAAGVLAANLKPSDPRTTRRVDSDDAMVVTATTATTTRTSRPMSSRRRWASHRPANGTLVAGPATARRLQQSARPRTRRVHRAITNAVVHRCKALHAERRRLEQHIGAAVAERVLNARSIAECSASIVDDVENASSGPSESRAGTEACRASLRSAKRPPAA